MSVLTYVKSLTDSVSHICGDATGNTYCGSRNLLIWDVAGNGIYNMAQPYSLFTYDSLTGILSIKATLN
jgi:hypothetical protein